MFHLLSLSCDCDALVFSISGVTQLSYSFTKQRRIGHPDGVWLRNNGFRKLCSKNTLFTRSHPRDASFSRYRYWAKIESSLTLSFFTPIYANPVPIYANLNYIPYFFNYFFTITLKELLYIITDYWRRPDDGL